MATTTTKTKSTKRKTKSTKSTTTKKTTKSKAKTNSTQRELAFSCDQSQLNDYLDFVKAAVPDKPTHPILGNVLVIANEAEQQLHLITYNLEFGMQVSFEAKVQQSGKMTLPKDIFQQMVKRFPKGDLTIICEIENQQEADTEPALKAILTSQEAERFEIMGMVAKEFPELPNSNQKCLNLSAGIVLAQLSGSLFAASSDETKRIINSSHFQLLFDEERGLNTITTWTTDGHRMALLSGSQEAKGEMENPVQFTVPIKVLKELERHLNPSDSLFIYYEGEAHNSGIVVFEWGNQRLVSRTLEGQYPDCAGVLQPFKDKHCRYILTERVALLRALERLAVLSNKSMKNVRLETDSSHSQLHLSIEHREIGKGQVTLDAQCEGDDISLLFNVRYLIEVVKAMSCSDVRVNLADALTPALIQPYGIPATGEPPIEAEYILAPLQ